MQQAKMKMVFISGPISPGFIADSIAKHQIKTTIGAHSIFLGQVRADIVENKKVVAIEYSAYDELAMKVFSEIREDAFSRYDLSCLHIYHSLGLVKSGELSLFVFTSSPRRKSAIEANTFIVEEIKARAAVWGKEIFEDDSYVWKENKS